MEEQIDFTEFETLVVTTTPTGITAALLNANPRLRYALIQVQDATCVWRADGKSTLSTTSTDAAYGYEQADTTFFTLRGRNNLINFRIAAPSGTGRIRISLA
jgi:hypothetical protein